MNKEQREKHANDLENIISKGRAIQGFEKTDAYKLIMDWIDKESDINKVLDAKKDDKDENIGYLKFGRALKTQLETWKKMADKKQIELNKILEEEDEHKG